MQVVAAAPAGRLHIGDQSSRRRGQRAERQVEEGGLVQPADDVAAAGPPRRPGRPPAREEHVAARLVQLLSNLAARLAAADHQHSPRRKCRGIAVILGVDPQHPGRERGGTIGAVRALVGARAHDNRVGLHVACCRAEQEATRRSRFQSVDADSLVDGRSEARCIAFQVADDLVTRHEALGILACVARSRQAHRPVRCHEAEAVPAIAPGLTNLSALQDDVIDAVLGQLMAHRKAGLAGADHHDRASISDPSSSPPFRGDRPPISRIPGRRQVQEKNPNRSARRAVAMIESPAGRACRQVQHLH